MKPDWSRDHARAVEIGGEMFRRILVPVDFTKNSVRSVRTAGRVASGTGAEVTLLHVIERIADDETGALRGFYTQLEKNARVKMQPLMRELDKKGVPAACHIVYGNRVAEILRFAEENKSDLIVMSSHKLPLRRPTVESWGTISYKVGILSRCPILLVK
ncbi:MAG TPA: universal stress protein [Thermoanaerobaculia bacterium]|nr:universal stress protein [Thermoanaerobaculia bacterium]